MRTIYVPLPEDAADRLRELARREMRGPREQAAWLILLGLRDAGLDVELTTRQQAALTKRDTSR
jgi:hypothetical protein